MKLIVLVILQDRSTGRQRTMVFYGAGLAGGANLGKLKIPKLPGPLPNVPGRATASLPSATNFDTTRPRAFQDFEGPGWLDFLSGDIIVAGYQFGYAHFKRIETTEHKGIWIGGVQFGGLGISGAILAGEWKFMN